MKNKSSTVPLWRTTMRKVFGLVPLQGLAASASVRVQNKLLHRPNGEIFF